MRHGKKRNKLGRTSSHRKALFANQATQLIQHEKIVSTVPKLKALRSVIEPMVTRARTDTVANRRLIARMIRDRQALGKLFDDIAPRFVSRPGGYTRIIQLGPRRGDTAEMGLMEFVGREQDE